MISRNYLKQKYLQLFKDDQDLHHLGIHILNLSVQITNINTKLTLFQLQF